MRLLVRLGTLTIGLCTGFVLSGVIGLFVSRGNAIRVLVGAAVVVAVCSILSGFTGKQASKKRW